MAIQFGCMIGIMINRESTYKKSPAYQPYLIRWNQLFHFGTFLLKSNYVKGLRHLPLISDLWSPPPPRQRKIDWTLRVMKIYNLATWVFRRFFTIPKYVQLVNLLASRR